MINHTQNLRTVKVSRWAAPALLLVSGALTIPASAAVGPPTTPDLVASSDSGVSNTDNITNKTRPVFSGKGIPLASLTLYVGGGSFATAIGSTVVLPSGQWSISPAYGWSNGGSVVSARQTYGGVQSTFSSQLTLYIDTEAPKPIVAVNLLPRHDHGSSNTDNVTNVVSPTFQSNFPAEGDFIDIYNYSKSTLIGSAPINGDGTWKCPVSVPFPTGNHSYYVAAKTRDLAGNVSDYSSNILLTIDTEAPAASDTPDLVSNDDTGASNSDNITNRALPTFTVHGKAGDTVKLYSASIGGGDLIAGAIVSDNGVATIKAMKPLLGNLVYALAVDKAGNEAPNSSPSLAVTIDTTPPPIPTPSLYIKTDSGPVGDNITNIQTPVISGLAANPTDVFSVTLDGVALSGGPITANPSTNQWFVVLPTLADGTHVIKATATDLAGNQNQSLPVNIVIDTKTPPAPSIPDLISTDDTGVSNTDNITNKTNLTFTGKGAPSSMVTLFNNDVYIAQIEAGSNGEWKVTANAMTPGPLHVTATSFDIAGNTSVASPALSGMLDLTPPTSGVTTPSSFYAKNMNVLGGPATDPTTNGDASGIASVVVQINKSLSSTKWTGSAWVSSISVPSLPTTFGNGQWSKTTGLPLLGANTSTQLQDGLYGVNVIVTDKAGNASSNGKSLTIDNVAPMISILSPIQYATVAMPLHISGAAYDNIGVSHVQVAIERTRGGVMFYWNGTSFVTALSCIEATVTGAGSQNATWSCDTQMPKAADLDEGAYSIYAASFDGAGNIKVSDERPITISLTEPTTPAAPDAAPSAGSS